MTSGTVPTVDVAATLQAAGIKVVASSRARVRDRHTPEEFRVARVPNPDLAAALSELTTGGSVPVVLVAHDRRVFVLSAGGSGIVAVQQIEGRGNEEAERLAERVSEILADAFQVGAEAAPKKAKPGRKKLTPIAPLAPARIDDEVNPTDPVTEDPAATIPQIADAFAHAMDPEADPTALSDEP